MIDAIYDEPELPFEELAAGLSLPLAPQTEEEAEDLPPRVADKSEYGTPPELFARYHDVHRFTLDGAAILANTKCPRFCTTPKEALRLLAEFGKGIQRPDGSLSLPDERVAYVDAFAQNWAGETVWLNCPYSYGEIPRWCEKAHQEAQRGATVVMLLLSDTSTDWYHDLVVPRAEVEYLRRRVRFIDPFTGELSGTPKFGSIIATYRPPEPVATAAPRPLIGPALRRRNSTTITHPLGNGHVHFILSEDDAGEPYEVFILNGHTGSDTYAHTEALGRIVSAALRFPLAPGYRRRDVVAHLVDQLRDIGGRAEATVASALATVLEEHWLRRDAA